MMFKPRQSFASAAAVLAEGLDNGSIVLDRTGPPGRSGDAGLADEPVGEDAGRERSTIAARHVLAESDAVILRMLVLERCDLDTVAARLRISKAAASEHFERALQALRVQANAGRI